MYNWTDWLFTWTFLYSLNLFKKTGCMADLSATIVRCNTSFTFYMYLSNPQIYIYWKLEKILLFLILNLYSHVRQKASTKLLHLILKVDVKNWRFFFYTYVYFTLRCIGPLVRAITCVKYSNNLFFDEFAILFSLIKVYWNYNYYFFGEKSSIE